MSYVDPADYFLEQKTTAEGTFMPPLNSVDLLPEVYREFQCRFGNFSINAAEFFHENSKAIRSSTRRISQNKDSISKVIQHYLESPYNYDPETINDISASPILPVADWMLEVPKSIHSLGFIAPTKLYAVDVYVLTGKNLRKVLPDKQILVKDRRFANANLERLNAAFYGPDENAAKMFQSLVFFVGCPWRYMMLYGSRGYRKMLMDLGHLLASYESEINSGHLYQSEYFYDNEIDRFLCLDGIEQSIQCILGVVGDEKGAKNHG